MTETGEYDPSEMAQRIAETQAGARYFADMAQALQASLSWDTERAGDLYPVMMDALDAIEEARNTCERAAKALDDRADALKTELNRTEKGTGQPRRQMAIRLSLETFEDIETLRMIRKCDGENWSLNETVTRLVQDYVEQYRKEITEFQERNRPNHTEE